MAAPHSPPRSVPATPPAGNADAAASTTATTSFVHAAIPYSVDFTDALMKRVLEPSAASDIKGGVCVVSERAASDPPAGSPQGLATLPLSSIDQAVLPKLEASDLPLPLDDARRIYTSAIPGVLLTHPGGFFEGGATTPSFAPTPLSTLTSPRTSHAITGTASTTADTVSDRQTFSPTRTNHSDSDSTSAYAAYVRHFLATHPTITTTADLHRAIATETAVQLGALRERMRAREDAMRRNADTEKKVAALVADRKLERKVVWEGLKERDRDGGKGEMGKAGAVV